MNLEIFIPRKNKRNISIKMTSDPLRTRLETYEPLNGPAHRTKERIHFHKSVSSIERIFKNNVKKANILTRSFNK